MNRTFFHSGWLFKLELKDQKEIDELMTEEQYKEFLKTDQH